jgi:hypothetical protein
LNRSQILNRLKAHAAARALPAGDTLRFPIEPPENRLLLAFVRMGGESSPWGIAYQEHGKEVVVLTVPEPRNRDLVAGMLAGFAPVLIQHFGRPAFLEPRFDPLEMPLRQLWVPNPTHVEMMHLLALRYMYAQKSDDQERLALLNALGRACAWAFRASQRAGQGLVMTATEVLRGSYSFPSDDLRQAHLGFLLAWLDGDSSTLEDRWKQAREKEQQPIATSLDPALERDTLQPVLERYHNARNAADEGLVELQSKKIHALLSEELRSRIGLVVDALTVLDADSRPINSGCASLVDDTLEQHIEEYLVPERRLAEGEPAYLASPDTDKSPAPAARRYNQRIAASEAHMDALIHHDRSMQLEEVEAGNAIDGKIVSVEDHGTGRKKRPIWTVKDDGRTSLRLRAGSQVCVAGLSNRVGRILDIASQSDGSRLFTIEITNGKLRPRKNPEILPATSEELVGEPLVLVSKCNVSFSRQRAYIVLRKNGPGAWLTHAKTA